MPPQTNSDSQNGDFDFMLKQQAQPKKKFGLPSGLNTPVKLLILAAGALIIAIAAALIFGGGDNNAKQVLDLMAQNQEIVRVSQAQETKFKDENTKVLAATTLATMSSQKFQLGDYLSRAKFKYGERELTARMNSQTDTQLETAAQNNNLDQAYVSYLKTSLTNYLDSLNGTLKTAQSHTLKNTLGSAADSIQTLLNSPQLKL